MQLTSVSLGEERHQRLTGTLNFRRGISIKWGDLSDEEMKTLKLRMEVAVINVRDARRRGRVSRLVNGRSRVTGAKQ